MEYYAVAVPVTENEVFEGKIVGVVTTEAEAIAECEKAGLKVLLPGRGGDISIYHYGDGSTHGFLKEDEKDMGCIFVTVYVDAMAA